MAYLRTQLIFIIIMLFNIAYNSIPFYLLKRLVAKLFGIRIGRNSYIHCPVKFAAIGNIVIMDNTVINSGCYLDNREKILIGYNVSIAHGTKIYTVGHDIDDPFFGLKGRQVIIGDNAVIFANVCIMPGVEMGEGAVAYPCSVVVRNVAPYDVVGGNPARRLRKRVKDIRYKLNYGFWFAG